MPASVSVVVLSGVVGIVLLCFEVYALLVFAQVPSVFAHGGQFSQRLYR